MSVLEVSQECWNLGLRAGAFVLRNLQIGPASPELRAEIDCEARQIRDRFETLAELRSLPELDRIRQVIRDVGVKPRNHPPSTQKLLEFAWKRGSLPEINHLVDAYNLMSLRTVCSLGAHDLDRLALPVRLQLFQGTETFRPFGSDEDRPVQRGEFGYVDAEDRVICRLDSLQAEFSKVTNETTSALLIVESTVAHTAEQLQVAFAETADAVKRFCGTEVEAVFAP